MTDKSALFTEYLPLVNAELVRIGFTAGDFRYLGSGGEMTRESLDAHLAELRRIPSGIGATAYFARYGIDFPALQREAAKLASQPAPPNER